MSVTAPHLGEPRKASGTGGTSGTRRSNKNSTPVFDTSNRCYTETTTTTSRTYHSSSCGCGCNGKTSSSGKRVSKWQGFKNFLWNCGVGICKGFKAVGKGLLGLVGGAFKFAGGLTTAVGVGLAGAFSALPRVSVGVNAGFGGGFGYGMYQPAMVGFGCGFPMMGHSHCHNTIVMGHGFHRPHFGGFHGFHGGGFHRPHFGGFHGGFRPHFGGGHGGFRPHFGGGHGGFRPHHRMC